MMVWGVRCFGHERATTDFATQVHNNKHDSWDKTPFAISNFISLNMLHVCCFTIHDIICATLFSSSPDVPLRFWY